MAMGPTGSETAAAQLLGRAVQLDKEKKFGEAVTCYEQGIRLLLQAAKETTDKEKKIHFKNKAETYLDRAEVLKEANIKQKEAERYHKQIQIEDGHCGYSYETVFGHLLDEILTAVEVEDSYIRAKHQIWNFLRFCELLVKKAKNLKKITLITTNDPENQLLQQNRFHELTNSLSKHGVVLDIIYSNNLHDREIRLDSGWIIKIGRGLDYFKRVDCFSIGNFDYDLRPCHKTTIDIFPKTIVKSS